MGDIQPQSTLTRVTARKCERDINQMDRTLDQMENRNDKSARSKTKPPPPPRKPCCSKDGLPPSFVVSLPPPMPLSEGGPLDFIREFPRPNAKAVSSCLTSQKDPVVAFFSRQYLLLTAVSGIIVDALLCRNRTSEELCFTHDFSSLSLHLLTFFL
ncbi:hypothetical protein KIN20_035471 [Parelaphostrongylus tenuis]|uniref:Uncharacterized protein n=1 Tax=Parelaphostrongylus tenuis TaxID=148309 RepID=A0AAD5RBU5_PARTN|nr:hypothetical protein KIN20_035471 [Parelaphostrongylus tenuis]